MTDVRKEIIRDGWEISQSKTGNYLLRYDYDVLGGNGALIRISEEVYQEAKKEGTNLKDLFVKYELHKNEKIYSIGKPIRLKPKQNTEAKYYGRGFLAEKVGDKYFLDYEMARHGGGSRRFEISKEVYEAARTGKYITTDLIKKYDLYHLDVSENDVK